MTYDFTTMPERHGMDAIAVDMIGRPGAGPEGPKEGFDAIPMWVADMNFATCPTIQEEIIRRTQHPLFGYFEPSEAYYNAIIRWQRDRNGVTGLTPREIGYENGVLGLLQLDAFRRPSDFQALCAGVLIEKRVSQELIRRASGPRRVQFPCKRAG